MSYEQLEEKARKLVNLSEIGKLLEWDEEVVMPEEGVKARSMQKSVVSGLHHSILTGEELGDALESIEQGNLSEEQKAVYRELKRERKRQEKVPEDLVERITEKKSEALEKWKKARKKDDFEIFAPELEEMVELKRRYAEEIDHDREPYQVLFEDYEPYIKFDRVEEIMQNLRDGLQPLIDEIREEEAENVFSGSFSEERQQELVEDVLEAMGYPEKRARLDTSTHPFTSGNMFDARITTRFNEEDLSEGITAAIHEFGHATYQLGLPDDQYGTPLGQAREMTVHESQSRLWENHVGRSREFMEFLKPMLERFEKFEDVSAEQLYRSINRVKHDNMIRVYADELTYHMHIYLRFRLERELVNGEIEVEELPQRWNDMMEQLLGIRPENDAEGVLQDIHWAQGSIGYFPTYSMGTVLAAQVFDSMKEDVDVEEAVKQGDFSGIKSWLREKIHSEGKRLETEELIEKATGEHLSADHFIEYVEEKYSEIYGL